IQKAEPVVQYFPLAFEMRKGGRKWFTAEEIRSECGRQKLLRVNGIKPARIATRLGIRSFMPLAAGLGEQVDHLLCVVDEFNGRSPKSDTSWSANVPERLKAFL